MMSSLPNNIAGQDAALETILNAISVWESNKKSVPAGSLVLAIVGQNGVGKSETGDIIIDCGAVFIRHHA